MFSLRYRHTTSDSPSSCKEEEKTPHDEKPYTSLKRSSSSESLKPSHHVVLGFVAAWMVRWWHSGTPHFITQGELILAQQINWTLKGQFHIGSAPPLATLMYSFFAGTMTGYHGTEPILYAGQTLEEFPLTSLRQLTMLISALVIPVIYTLMRVLGCSHTTALFTSGLFIFETGMVVQSRFISVAPLFILLSCLACCFFFSTPPLSSFRRQCWTGVLLGGALCTQWHAGSLMMFFLAVSGLEMWKRLGDPAQSLKQIPKWIGIPCFTLVLLPLSVYVALFQWHFHKVPNAGDHDLFLSSPLRYSLTGNSFEPVQQYIAYGSHVVLKHVSSNNGYLHSDDKIFEGGSNQNQVTVYPYEDMNNIWVIQKLDGKTYADEPEYLYNNNAFKLEHYASTRKLHSHDHKAPVHTGEGFYEVTSYGNPTVTEDGNDVWWIRTVTEDEGYDTTNFDPINALTTRFRLLHHQGCYLASHYDPLTLVEGGAQQEVSCMNNAKTTVSSWVFEYAHHPKLEDISPVVEYGSPTITKKLRLVHDLMRNYKKVVYDRLSSIPADETEPTDTMMYSFHDPQPFLWLKTRYAYLIWDDLTGRSVYVVLHPFLRTLTVSTLLFFPLVALFSAFSFQLHWSRPSMWCQQFWSNRLMQTATFMLGGTLIHATGLLVVPAHMVTLSDMLPTLLFGTFSFSCLFEGFLTPHLRRPQVLLLVMLLISGYSFIRWSQGIDGSSPWTSRHCQSFHLKNIDCEKYPLVLSDPAPFLEDIGPIYVMDPNLMEGADHPQEDHTLESRHILMPGTPLRFEYERGQEARAELEIAKVRDAAYREAVHKWAHPAHRFVRATLDQDAPTLDKITEFRQQMHQYVLEKEKDQVVAPAPEEVPSPVPQKKKLVNKKQGGGLRKKKKAKKDTALDNEWKR